MELRGEVVGFAEDGLPTWAFDLNTGGPALLIKVLYSDRQRLVYLPGPTVYHAASADRSSDDTDCKPNRCGVLSAVGPEDRSAPCLTSDMSAAGKTRSGLLGRASSGVIGACSVPPQSCPCRSGRRRFPPSDDEGGSVDEVKAMDEVLVAVGMDIHLEEHVPFALDPFGSKLGVRSSPNAVAGYRQLLERASGLAVPERRGVEGTVSYGA